MRVGRKPTPNRPARRTRGLGRPVMHTPAGTGRRLTLSEPAVPAGAAEVIPHPHRVERMGGGIPLRCTRSERSRWPSLDTNTARCRTGREEA